MIARLPVNARSECVAPSTFPVGGVVESIRMFHAACAASQRPAFRPTRGSGDGAVADTIGSTGFGMTAGGGGGGGGGVPRPPAPPAAPAAGVSADGVGAPAGGVAVGGGVLGAGGGGAVVGAAAGGAAVWPECAHAFVPMAAAANSTAASSPWINSDSCFLMTSDPPAFRACVQSRSLDRRIH